mmetsp:Transcript_65296/g.103953  ORF Transcript_65296/g.103953 Transcript_65296/m.103953 type:complete len:250 (-) Transcript_65296:231-980(-)
MVVVIALLSVGCVALVVQFDVLGLDGLLGRRRRFSVSLALQGRVQMVGPVSFVMFGAPCIAGFLHLRDSRQSVLVRRIATVLCGGHDVFGLVARAGAICGRVGCLRFVVLIIAHQVRVGLGGLDDIGSVGDRDTVLVVVSAVGAERRRTQFRVTNGSLHPLFALHLFDGRLVAAVHHFDIVFLASFVGRQDGLHQFVSLQIIGANNEPFVFLGGQTNAEHSVSFLAVFGDLHLQILFVKRVRAFEAASR